MKGEKNERTCIKSTDFPIVRFTERISQTAEAAGKNRRGKTASFRGGPEAAGSADSPLKTRYARPSHLPRTKRMHPNTGDPVQDQHGHKISANRKNKDPLSLDLIHSGRRARRRPLLYPMKKRASPGFSCDTYPISWTCMNLLISYIVSLIV